MNTDVTEVKVEDPKAVCQYCHRSKVNSLEWGPLYQLEGVTVHYFCMLFSAGLSQHGADEEGILGFLPKDIKKEIRRGEKLKCKFCKTNNATIGCSVKNCKFSYHYPCGLENDCSFQFIHNFESYCGKHREKVVINVPEDDWDCAICFEPIKDENPLWPPCCKKRVFHRTCILEMAKSAGIHFFKCPLCNDKDVFSEAMRKGGVYLPDRDAAWETEPDAYADHARVHSRCDAEECACPKGREHSSKSDHKPWKIVRCGGCGAFAIHKHCGRLTSLSWRCQTCADILSDRRNSRIHRHQYDSSSEEEEAEPVISVREAVMEAPRPPDETSSGSSDSASDAEVDENVSPNRLVYDPRYRNNGKGKRFIVSPVQTDSGSTDEEQAGSEEEDEDDTVFISPNSNVHKRLFGPGCSRVSQKQNLKAKPKRSSLYGVLRDARKGKHKDVKIGPDQGHDRLSNHLASVFKENACSSQHPVWNANNRVSIYAEKLNALILQSGQSTSATASLARSSEEVHYDPPVSIAPDPARTTSSGNSQLQTASLISFPPLGRDTLIKKGSSKYVQGKIEVVKPAEVVSEVSSQEINISPEGVPVPPQVQQASMSNSDSNSYSQMNALVPPKVQQGSSVALDLNSTLMKPPPPPKRMKPRALPQKMKPSAPPSKMKPRGPPSKMKPPAPPQNMKAPAPPQALQDSSSTSVSNSTSKTKTEEATATANPEITHKPEETKVQTDSVVEKQGEATEQADSVVEEQEKPEAQPDLVVEEQEEAIVQAEVVVENKEENTSKILKKTISSSEEDLSVVHEGKSSTQKPPPPLVDVEDSDSDLEIISETIVPSSEPCKPAILELLRRNGAFPVPVVRLGVDDHQNDQIEFPDSVDDRNRKGDKPAFNFSPFRASPHLEISQAFQSVIDKERMRGHFTGAKSPVVVVDIDDDEEEEVKAQNPSSGKSSSSSDSSQGEGRRAGGNGKRGRLRSGPGPKSSKSSLPEISSCSEAKRAKN